MQFIFFTLMLSPKDSVTYEILASPSRRLRWPIRKAQLSKFRATPPPQEGPTASVAYSQRPRSLVESWHRKPIWRQVAYQIRRKCQISRTQRPCANEFHALKLVSQIETRGKLGNRNEKVDNFASPEAQQSPRKYHFVANCCIYISIYNNFSPFGFFLRLRL